MTENIKKLLQLASDNEELKNRLNKASKDEIISIAKENGVTLTDADFEQSSEVSDDELNAVAGGDIFNNTFCDQIGVGINLPDKRPCICIRTGFAER